VWGCLSERVYIDGCVCISVIACMRVRLDCYRVIIICHDLVKLMLLLRGNFSCCYRFLSLSLSSQPVDLKYLSLLTDDASLLPHNCKYYTFMNWSPCNPKNWIQHRIMVLKDKQPSLCNPIKITKRKCLHRKYLVSKQP